VTLTSLWQDRHPRSAPAEPVETNGQYDVAVVGAGQTGLTTALLAPSPTRPTELFVQRSAA
jgi:hypothetical protein